MIESIGNSNISFKGYKPVMNRKFRRFKEYLPEGKDTDLRPMFENLNELCNRQGFNVKQNIGICPIASKPYIEHWGQDVYYACFSVKPKSPLKGKKHTSNMVLGNKSDIKQMSVQELYEKLEYGVFTAIRQARKEIKPKL